MKPLHILVLALLAPIAASSQMTLSPLFSDHAVLQRDRAIPVFGRGAPGEVLTVTLGGESAKATVGADGAWSAQLGALHAGGPFALVVAGASGKLEAKDILIGEVWLASGQSNMVVPLKEAVGGEGDAKAAKFEQVRYFDVPAVNSATPVETLKGDWNLLTPETAPGWSAVAFYFARSLAEHLHVPVGIVHAAVGSTSAESWTPLPALLADPKFAALAKQQNDNLGAAATAGPSFLHEMAGWETKFDVHSPGAIEAIPASLAGESFQPVALPINAARMPLKGAGTIWLKRSFSFAEAPEGAVRLIIGPALDTNVCFVNGKKIGEMAYTMEAANIAQKSYIVPRGTLRQGDNEIVLRYFTHNAQQPKMAIGNQMMGVALTGKPRLKLDGEGWSYWVESDKPLSAEAVAALPLPLEVVPKRSAASFYDGMIHPLHDFGIRGTIWYAGEANAPRAAEYPQLMGDLIGAWRKQFRSEFPFYIVQLPVFTNPSFAAMRDAQARIPALVPNTAMVVTIDTGSLETLHPRDKKPVGERLALIALHRDYGEKIEDSGPMFASATAAGGSLVIHLTHAEGLHAARAPHFSVAGADGKYAAAVAAIKGETIVLTSAEVARPVSARYAETADPVGCDVYNGAGLPLAPFDSGAAKRP